MSYFHTGDSSSSESDGDDNVQQKSEAQGSAAPARHSMFEESSEESSDEGRQVRSELDKRMDDLRDVVGDLEDAKAGKNFKIVLDGTNCVP